MSNELVAVTSLGIHTPDRRDLLLFDRIAIAGLEASIGNVTNPAIRDEIEFLAEETVVFDVKYDHAAAPDPDSPEQQLIEIATVQLVVAQSSSSFLWELDESKRIEVVNRIIPKLATAPLINHHRVAAQILESFRQLLAGHSEAVLTEYGKELLSSSASGLLIRAFCPHLKKKHSVDAVPLLGTSSFGSPMAYSAGNETVVNLVVRHLPVPHDDIPIKDVLAFRNDEEQQTKLSRLRRWIRSSAKKVTEQEADMEDLEVELESLVEDYKEYMRVQKMKWHATSFETVVTMTAQMLEGLAKLKLKDVVDSLFTLRKSKVGLLEAELKAPGREIAYLVTAGERF